MMAVITMIITNTLAPVSLNSLRVGNGRLENSLKVFHDFFITFGFLNNTAINVWCQMKTAYSVGGNITPPLS